MRKKGESEGRGQRQASWWLSLPWGPAHPPAARLGQGRIVPSLARPGDKEGAAVSGGWGAAWSLSHSVSASPHLTVCISLHLCVLPSHCPAIPLSPLSKSMASYFGLCFTVSGSPLPICLSVSPVAQSAVQALFLGGRSRLDPGRSEARSEQGKEETGERESEDRTALLSRNRSRGPGDLPQELGGRGGGWQGATTGTRDRGTETQKEKGREKLRLEEAGGGMERWEEERCGWEEESEMERERKREGGETQRDRKTGEQERRGGPGERREGGAEI